MAPYQYQLFIHFRIHDTIQMKIIRMENIIAVKGKGGK